jgi:biopolymer transport protein ExbB
MLLAIFLNLNPSRGHEQTVNWDLPGMLCSMSGLGQTVVILLVMMLVWLIVVMIERSYRYRVACEQSRAFVRQVGVSFRDHKLDEVIFIAGCNSKSHIAKVVASGLAAFQAVPLLLPDAEVIEIATRGLRRSAADVHVEMKRGLGGLANIASTAPFVGLFGTVIGILNAFKGCGMAKAACTAAVDGAISEALVTTALGLLVAVPAVWCYNYLSDRMEVFDIETQSASRELMTYLIIGLRKYAVRRS